jgi:hypothetical protein
VHGATKGWYPDPLGGDGERWWDGDSWTDQVQAASARYVQPEPAPYGVQDAPDVADPADWGGPSGPRRQPAVEKDPPLVTLGGAQLSQRAEQEIVETIRRSHTGRAAARKVAAVTLVLAVVALTNFNAASAWQQRAEAERALAELQEQQLSERLADVAGEKAQEQDLRRQLEILLVEATIVGDELIQCMEYQAQVYDGFNRRALGQIPTDWGQYYQFLDDVSAYCRSAIEGHGLILSLLRGLQ